MGFPISDIFWLLVVASLIAGFGGTLLMTVVQMIEMKIMGRSASLTPAMVAAKTLRFNLDNLNDRQKRLVNHLTHWLFGTGLGLFLVVLAYLGKTPNFDMFFWFFIFAWLQGPIVMKLYGVAPWPWKWGVKSNLFHMFFHICYAYGAYLTFMHVSIPIVTKLFS